MSSHHIVRDRQEPALLIHRLSDFDTSQLHGLLEWSPTVVCCEPALERYVELGHKVDIALVSFNFQDRWEKFLANQQPLKILALHNAQLMDTGLEVLERENYPAVNIVTDTDSLHDVIDELIDWIKLIDVVVYSGKQRYVFARNGEFSKWLAADSHLRALALDEDPVWTTEGFDKNFSSEETDEIMLKITNEGTGKIHCNVPFVIEEDL